MTAPDTYGIGELARRSGLPVKTIRFYSDAGILPPAGRTPSGYRRYGPADLARLELVRTLRELGVDLATIRRVLDRQATLADALTLHEQALDAQLRALRLRRAVLRAVVRGDASPDYLARAQRMTRASDAERRAAVDQFLDRAMAGVPVDPEFARGLREASAPQLPDEPSAEQIDAWLELAELIADPEFARRTHERTAWFWEEAGDRYDDAAHRAAQQAVVERAIAAAQAGITPDDARAGPIVDAFVRMYAEVLGRPDDRQLRAMVLDRFERGHDPRVERYWELLGIINGWPAGPSPVTEAYRWLVAGLRRSLVAAGPATG